MNARAAVSCLVVLGASALALAPSAASGDTGAECRQNQRGCVLGRQCASCAQPWYPGCPAGGYNYRLAFDYPWSMAPSRPRRCLTPLLAPSPADQDSAVPPGVAPSLEAPTTVSPPAVTPSVTAPPAAVPPVSAPSILLPGPMTHPRVPILAPDSDEAQRLKAPRAMVTVRDRRAAR